MLDLNALSQLSQLKTNLRAQKNLAEGTVRGTQGRFGFVLLDDGREAFLPPEAMARVFPGDRVEVVLTEDDKGKFTAELEKLIKSDTHLLVGQYLVRGKGHFIATDMPQLNRWIFLPPKDRNGVAPDDYLIGKITRHPFSDGKGQASVVRVLGSPATPGIEHAVTVHKHQLLNEWSAAEQAQTQALLDQPADTSARTDLTHIPFVTIDAVTTKDMDDALYAEATAAGWRLRVAIADPHSGIGLDSPLGKAAWTRGNTAYLPGGAVTMIPEPLANNTYSLIPDALRPAWVFTIDIDREGHVTGFDYEHATIRSRHKLSYTGVAAWLEQGDSDAVAADTQDMLKVLDDCAAARNRFRQQHMLLMEERDDFELVLNEQKQVERVERVQRNRGHQVVEESMLVTNACAGELFAQHPQTGIFSAHGGFREDRCDDIRAVLAEDLPHLAGLDITSADGYRALIQGLQQLPTAAPLLAALRLMLRAGELTCEARPHLGLGMQYYATVTSPIRRYNDLYNHAALAAIKSGRKIKAPDATQLAELQAQIGKTRQSARDLEQWLIRLYMETKIGTTGAGKIARINSQGISVRLNDSGITGFVKLGSKDAPISFDARRMVLTGENLRFEVEQPVQIRVVGVNHERRQINFELVD